MLGVFVLLALYLFVVPPLVLLICFIQFLFFRE